MFFWKIFTCIFTIVVILKDCDSMHVPHLEDYHRYSGMWHISNLETPWILTGSTYHGNQ